jgi:hypothetical protein
MADWMAKSHKKPWAHSTFFERLKVLKEQGRIIGGGGQDETYSVVTQPGEGSGEGVGGTAPEAQQNHSDHSPLQAEWSSRSGFWSSGALRKHSENENRSGSNRVNNPELSKGTLRQTAELFEKAKAKADASAKAPKPVEVKKSDL